MSGQREHRVAVVGARLLEGDVVGREARAHGRVHRVGHGRRLRRTGTGRRRCRGTPPRSTGCARCRPARRRRPGSRDGAPGCPSAAPRAGSRSPSASRRTPTGSARARRGVGRQQAGLGAQLVQVLGDRQRVPHRRRRRARGAGTRNDGDRQQQLRAGGRDRRLDEHVRRRTSRPARLAQQPPAQRPGAVVPAVDRQRRVGHVRSPPVGRKLRDAAMP